MGKFRTEPVKKSMYAILDHLHVAAQKHHVYGFIEVDVTQAKLEDINQITKEIRKAQHTKMNRGGVLENRKSDTLTKYYRYIPRFLRRWIYKKLTSKPSFVKKYMGTIILTSVGMFGRGSAWPLMSSVHNLAFGVGSISKKPRFIEDDLQNRQILHLTIGLNHDIIDGGPSARFVSQFIGLLEEGHGL